MNAFGGADQPRTRHRAVIASADTCAGFTGRCVAALIAVLVVAPLLAGVFDGGGGPACSSIRLNRGFVTSVAKTKALPHPVSACASTADVGQTLSRIVAGAAVLDESSIESPAHRSPETRRGPPNARPA